MNPNSRKQWAEALGLLARITSTLVVGVGLGLSIGLGFQQKLGWGATSVVFFTMGGFLLGIIALKKTVADAKKK